MSEPVRLLITVHGIRTFGQWQERLETAVRQSAGGDRIDVVKIDYGYFSALAFLIPFARWLSTRRMRKLIASAIAERPWQRVDVVAHSFGTHLVAHGLRGMSREEAGSGIHTLILAGSVLKPWFSWSTLMDGEDARVGRVVNDCGTKDSILVLSHACVLLTGMAGRVGFRGRLGARLRNRYFAFGHSGYFVTGSEPNDFMERWWLPLIVDDGEVKPHDERSAGAGRPQLNWALEYAEPVKISVYIALLWLLLQPVAGWYGDSRARQLATRIDALVSRSADLSVQRDDEAAAVVALGALALEVQHSVGRRDVVEGTVRAALSARPFHRALIGTDFEARSAAVGGNKSLIVAVSPDAVVRVWTGSWDAPPAVLQSPSRSVTTALGLDAGSTRFAVGDAAGMVWIADASATEPRFTGLAGCEGAVQTVAWHPRDLVIAGTEGRELCVWELASPSQPSRVIETENIVQDVIVGFDGALLAAAEGDRVRFLLGFGAQDERSISVEFPGSIVRALAFDDRRDRLAVAAVRAAGAATTESADISTVSVLPLGESGASRQEITADAHIRALAFAADGKLVAAGSDGVVRVWETRLDHPPTLLPAHDGPVVAVDFDDSGQRLLTAGIRPPAVRMWDFGAAVGAPRSFRGPANPVAALAFCGGQGEILALAYPYDEQLLLWEHRSNARGDWRSTAALPARDGVLRSAACTPALPGIVATGRGSTMLSSDTRIRLWDLANPETERAVFEGHEASVRILAFDDDGEILVSAGDVDRRVRIRHMESGSTFDVPADHLEGPTISLAVSSGSATKLLAVGNDTGEIRVLEVTAEGVSPMMRLSTGAGETVAGRLVRDLAFSVGGVHLAAVAPAGDVMVWDVRRQGEPPLMLNRDQGEAHAARSLAFSPRSDELAIGRADGSIAMLRLGNPIDRPTILPGAERAVLALRFSRDGSDLAAGYADGTVQVWPSFDAVMSRACEVVTRAAGRPDLERILEGTAVCR